MSASIPQDELSPSDFKTYVSPEHHSAEIDAPALPSFLNVNNAPHAESAADQTINQANVLAACLDSRQQRERSDIEYRGVRITAIVSALAVVAWTAICIVFAFGRLDTDYFGFLRNGLAFANDNLGERLQAANVAIHKVSRPVLAPTLVASETAGAVNTELPLAIEVTNYTPKTAINLSGLAAGTTLSSGTGVTDGQWRVAIDDLPNTRVIPPPEYVGPMTINVELRNDDDRTIVRVPLRLTWFRAGSQSTGAVENPLPPVETSVVNVSPREVPTGDEMPKDLTAALPQQSEPQGAIPALIKPIKKQKLVKKHRQKTVAQDPEPETYGDFRPKLPLPIFGDIIANTGTARNPTWGNANPDIIDRSWDRCREPFDCNRKAPR